MLLWHVGATTFLFRWIFRDPMVDLRFLALGAVLPNLIDTPLAVALGFPDDAYRLWAHSLLFPIVCMTLVMVLTRRGPGRKPWMALAVGLFFHLLLDRMWALPETILWPFLGSTFTSMGVGDLAGLVGSAVTWWPVAAEIAGLVYLGLVWGWAPAEDRSAFQRTGVLRLGAPTAPPS